MGQGNSQTMKVSALAVLALTAVSASRFPVEEADEYTRRSVEFVARLSEAQGHKYVPNVNTEISAVAPDWNAQRALGVTLQPAYRNILFEPDVGEFLFSKLMQHLKDSQIAADDVFAAYLESKSAKIQREIVEKATEWCEEKDITQEDKRSLNRGLIEMIYEGHAYKICDFYYEHKYKNELEKIILGMLDHKTPIEQIRRSIAVVLNELYPKLDMASTDWLEKMENAVGDLSLIAAEVVQKL